MRKCRDCGQMKDDAEFYSKNTGKCKPCYRSRRKAEKSESQNRHREYNLKTQTFPWQASKAVCNEVNAGRMERPDRCSRCKKKCKPEGHHFSYKRWNWLDVEWLCEGCHVNHHRNAR